MDPIDQYSNIQALVKKEIADAIAKYANDQKYAVTQVPVHTHNGIDSPKIDADDIPQFVPLPATPGGVVSPDVLDTQTINDIVLGSQNPPTIYVNPVPIIYGYGVGVHSAFNGGDAPNGSAVFFENGLSLSKLYIKTEYGWYGIPVDSVI